MSEPLGAEDRGRLEELFELACELPPEEHAAFVERECGSKVELRVEIERLLAGLRAEDVLARIHPDAPTRIGTWIDSYELLELAGQGGMGEVYVARQHEPIERRVALKVIKAGMDSAQVVARFEAERQVLALMEHKNIARIIDAGTTPDGRPYFVMEYVDGEPIHEYCDRHKLSTRARIELFLDLCDGVQHAHQKGVIHRDLKPSNLMVMKQGGRALPMIIDFGVARATGGGLADRTLHTMLGQVVGTLDYMSPEQADPSSIDIDTRSDVYSLGVVLYQLLSGLLPFDEQLGAQLPLSEAQRILREQDPPTPSTRVRRQVGMATRVAPLRGTSDRGLVRQLSGNLDWICLKALEKDPSRRYLAASELAADLRRHLANLPVLAGRPGKVYLARKFLRRHRVGAAAALLISASLVTGLTGVVSGALKTEVQAQVARREAAKSLRLSDMLDLKRLEVDADKLWPPYPDKIPEYVSWMARARELLAHRELHAAALAEIEGRCGLWTDEVQRMDRETHPRATELANKRAELEFRTRRAESGELMPAVEARARQRIAELEGTEIPALLEQVRTRRTWDFEEPADAWWHPHLVGLLDEMDVMESTLLTPGRTTSNHGWSIPDRLELAHQLEADFAVGGVLHQAWERALPRIHAARADLNGDGTEELIYPGPPLTMQMGLVPLGPDLDSKLWEFAVVHSGDPVERDANGELIRTDGMAVVLVLLPKGRFVMGAQRKDPAGECYDPRAVPFKESPPHLVNVDAFFMSKYELTESQWFHATHDSPDSWAEEPKQGRELLPVDVVSWRDSATFCQRMGLVLPHEEQWEYAARAGTQTVWSTGFDEESTIEGYANLFDQAGFEQWPLFEVEAGGHSPIDDGFAQQSPVGSFLPNRFGLYDVHGNVAEWCLNPPYRYPTARAWQAGDARSARGGNARSAGVHARSSARREGPADIIGPGYGFRPAMLIAE